MKQVNGESVLVRECVCVRAFACVCEREKLIHKKIKQNKKPHTHKIHY